MARGARNALWNGDLAETWKPKATNETHKEVMKVILTWQSVSYTATLVNVLPQTLPWTSTTIVTLLTLRYLILSSVA